MNAPATIRQSTPLLISETPLQFLPSLAKKLGGANEALILQQLHFLLVITEKARNNHNYFNKRWWVYNSYEQWREEHFPWLSESTIKRIFSKLKTEGYILSKERKEGRLQLGNWYTINYEKLTKKTIRVSRNPIVHIEQGGVQDEHGTGSKSNSEGVQDEHLFYIAENTTENTYRKNGGGNSPLATDNPSPSPLPTAAVSETDSTTPRPTAQEIVAPILEQHERAKAQEVREYQARETEILAAFGRLNTAIRNSNKGYQPITGTRKLAEQLARRGETEASMKAAWETCKTNGIKPMGAFMKWITEGYLPPQQEGHETQVIDGVVHVWVDLQGWQPIGKKAT